VNNITIEAKITPDLNSNYKKLHFIVEWAKYVLKLRKKDKDALAEEDSLIDLYRGALNV
jgi:uncharacterized protein (UPF0335 family)